MSPGCCFQTEHNAFNALMPSVSPSCGSGFNIIVTVRPSGGEKKNPTTTATTKNGDVTHCRLPLRHMLLLLIGDAVMGVSEN